LRWEEKAESTAREGWTEMTRSLERYAILATVQSQLLILIIFEIQS
jgi:hypothetical protein